MQDGSSNSLRIMVRRSLHVSSSSFIEGKFHTALVEEECIHFDELARSARFLPRSAVKLLIGIIGATLGRAAAHILLALVGFAVQYPVRYSRGCFRLHFFCCRPAYRASSSAPTAASPSH